MDVVEIMDAITDCPNCGSNEINIINSFSMAITVDCRKCKSKGFVVKTPHGIEIVKGDMLS